MKSGLYKFLFLGLLTITSICNGQNPDWINYTDGNLIFSTVEDENYYWAATYGGLSRVSKTNGELFVFTKANSGLPDNFIYCIAQDGFGNKWLGTYDGGIVKYDGINFSIYNSQNTPLLANKINAITVDHQNNMWAGTDSGLVKFDGAIWTLYDFQEFNFDEPKISALFVDNIGNLWVSLTWWGLVKFDGFNWIEFINPNIGIVYSITQSIINNEYWFGTKSFGIWKYDGINWTNYNTGNSGIPENQIESLSLDLNNIVWVATLNNGLARFDGINWVVYTNSNSILKAPWIMHVRTNGSNEKFIGTQKGLYKITDLGWTEILTSNSTLPTNMTRKISISPNGKKWVCSIHGLSSLENENWMAYPELDIDSIRLLLQTVKEDFNNRVWIGTEYQGLIEFDGINKIVYKTSNSPLPDNRITSIEIDDYQNKWIGTQNGLSRFDGTNWNIYNSTNSGLPVNDISDILIDNGGKKWIGTRGGGFAIFNDTTWIVYDMNNSLLPSNYITSIAIDLDGKSWIGTYEGLCEFDGNNWVLYNKSNSAIPDNCITDIAVDSLNAKWISCYDGMDYFTIGGLVKFHGSLWEVWDKDNSPMPSNSIVSIAIDQYNTKWLGFQWGGVSVFNENGITLPVELISFTAENINNTVNLKWSTASELNNRGFEVERKQVGSSRQHAVGNLEWNTIGFVDGNGTQAQTYNYNFIDSTVTSGNYSYRLKQIDFDGSFTYSNIVEIDLTLPNTFSLSQNYPNPFNPTTKIKYSIPFFSQSPPFQGGVAKPGWFVTIKVYDLLGREIATLVNEEKPAGTYEIEFNASNLASGVYFYSLNAGDFKMTKKMMMLK